MTDIILVRHCEAEGNIKKVFQGSTNSDITENGKLQLAALSERMKEFPFEYIYSSPLKRAYKTAQAANEHMKIDPIITDDGLREINAGVIEGIKYADMPNLYPEDAKNWNLSPMDFAPENGETMKSVFERGWNTILKIAKKHSGSKICVASHGCTIRNILCRAKGWPIEKLNDVEWCDNTAISILRFDDDFNCELILENDATHLSEEISTLAKQVWWKKESREGMLFE